MPRCIYCMLDKPDDAFDPEHVFSRGLCGPGANWTLTHEVCKACNGRFSAFEAHWMRRAIESTARNFYGLEGRSEKQRFDRAQPVELDDLYLLNKGDSLVYEAGFAFPADRHFRPQIIQTDSGLLSLVATMSDAAALQAAVKALNLLSLAVAIPQWQKRHGDWLVAEIEAKPGKRHVITGFEREPKPRGLWLRSFPPDLMVQRNKLIETDHAFSTRMALDHRGRLYLRAANVEAVPSFFSDLAAGRSTTKGRPDVADGDQTMLFGFELDLVKIYQAVLKNGFNLFTHFYGADAARDPTFNLLRKMLMNDPTDRNVVQQHCRMYDADTPDFPKSGNPKEHRLQLELNSEGVVYFRMRLFDSLGYEALLGLAPASVLQDFQSKRVVVDYTGAGIREVDRWA